MGLSLNTAISLIYEAIYTQEQIKEMKGRIAKLDRNDPRYWTERYDIVNSYSPKPTKTHVNECLKMARRIVLENYLTEET